MDSDERQQRAGAARTAAHKYLEGTGLELRIVEGTVSAGPRDPDAGGGDPGGRGGGEDPDDGAGAGGGGP